MKGVRHAIAGRSRAMYSAAASPGTLNPVGSVVEKLVETGRRSLRKD